MNDGRPTPTSPTCCKQSRDTGVVALWETSSGVVRWVMRPYDAKRTGVVHSSKFCPFCGVALTVDHMPFVPADVDVIEVLMNMEERFRAEEPK